MYLFFPLNVSFIYKVRMVKSRNAKEIFAVGLTPGLLGRARRREEEALRGNYIGKSILWGM